jgi:hypothetical protein
VPLGLLCDFRDLFSDGLFVFGLTLSCLLCALSISILSVVRRDRSGRSLSVCSLTAVVRPAAAQERRSNFSAGGPGPTRGIPEEREQNCNYPHLRCPVCNLMTFSSISSRRKNYSITSSGSRAGVTRWGDGGPLQAVAAPLTPRPRGTIYEAPPFFLERRPSQDERRLSMNLPPPTCQQFSRRRSAGRGPGKVPRALRPAGRLAEPLKNALM